MATQARESREVEAHEAFAVAHTVNKTSEDVWVLDQFCHADSFHEARKPLVLNGPPGAGKSTLLASWAQRRKNRSRVANRSRGGDQEFLFEFYCGCTRASLQVSTFLHQIMTAMKKFFGIKQEIVDTDERLSWDFPRFVEAAARRGRVIIILDGVDRMMSGAGTAASLRWLPFSFPPKVRVVLACRSFPAAPVVKAPKPGSKRAPSPDPAQGIGPDAADAEGEPSGPKKVGVPRYALILAPSEDHQADKEDRAQGRVRITRPAQGPKKLRKIPGLEFEIGGSVGISRKIQAEIARRTWMTAPVELVGGGAPAEKLVAAYLAEQRTLLARHKESLKAGAVDPHVTGEAGSPPAIGDSDGDAKGAAAAARPAVAGFGLGTALSATASALRLYPSQVARIGARFREHSCTFLYALLRGLTASAWLGHDVCAVLDDCLADDVATVYDLLRVLLRRWARGNDTPSLERVQELEALKERNRASGDTSTVIPSSLLGGRRVRGFGKWLGRCLAFVHESRYGLSDRELWTALAAATDTEAAKQPDGGGGGGGGGSGGGTPTKAAAEPVVGGAPSEMRDGLLLALEAFGVARCGQLLSLPMSNDHTRALVQDVVLNEGILEPLGEAPESPLFLFRHVLLESSPVFLCCDR